jgi:hypothetical protein
MKVYELYLEKWQSFTFYINEKESKAILINDLMNPIPPTEMFWDKENNTYAPNTNKLLRIHVTPVRVKSEEMDAWIKCNLQDLIEQRMGATPNFKEHNVIVMRKDWKDGTHEVGMCTYVAYTDIVNEKLQRLLDSILALKVFW